MKKILTLKKNYEFKNVLSKGKYYSGKSIEVIIRPSHKKQNYIGIAVGVKQGKAVRRNHVKRLIRENYRLLEKNLKKGYDIVFLWKKKNSIGEANFWKIQEDMKYIFKKAKLYEETEEI